MVSVWTLEHKLPDGTWIVKLRTTSKRRAYQDRDAFRRRLNDRSGELVRLYVEHPGQQRRAAGPIDTEPA